MRKLEGLNWKRTFCSGEAELVFFSVGSPWMGGGAPIHGQREGEGDSGVDNRCTRSSRTYSWGIPAEVVGGCGEFGRGRRWGGSGRIGGKLDLGPLGGREEVVLVPVRIQEGGASIVIGEERSEVAECGCCAGLGAVRHECGWSGATFLKAVMTSRARVGVASRGSWRVKEA